MIPVSFLSEWINGWMIYEQMSGDWKVEPKVKEEGKQVRLEEQKQTQVENLFHKWKSLKK